MNGILKKLLTLIVLPVAIVGLVYVIVDSIMQPVEFNKQKDYRESVAVQRLKDIRTLQVAFKGVNNRFSPTVDSLKDFYLNGQMSVIMQVGSQDDSLAVAHTEAVKKANKKITDMVKEESDKVLGQVLKNASEHMKIRYHRGDN